MTEKELQDECRALRYMESEYAEVARGGAIMVTAPGSHTKHLYRGKLAEKVCRAIARTLEQERLALMSRGRKANQRTHKVPTYNP